jgi:hypothetical protein
MIMIRAWRLLLQFKILGRNSGRSTRKIEFPVCITIIMILIIIIFLIVVTVFSDK